jgi:hypothetical protein
MRGKQVIAALHKKLGTKNDRALAITLGVSTQTVRNWDNNSPVTPLQVANLVNASRDSARKDAYKGTLRPIVEFFKISTNPSKIRASRELFTAEDGRNTPHPYLLGLKEELKKSHGVYIFFDSRGQAIYAGKARQQTLWREMTLAFNRNRGEVQAIRRTKHP